MAARENGKGKSPESVNIPFRRTKNGITINVRVLPRASRTGVDVLDDGLRIKLTSPPVGGAANDQMLEILSETLRIRKSAFRIVRGLSSKNKVVEIAGIKDI
jgi:uncharacterized protein (TIGR00251 family)